MADEHSLNSNLAEIPRQAGIQAEPQVTFTDNKGKPEEMSKRAEIAVNEAFKKFDQEDIDSIQTQLRKEDTNELAEVTNFKGLLVDLLTCFMFHYKLDTIIKDQPQFRRKANCPPILQDCIDSENRIARFLDAYQKWLTVDYKDILAWNSAVLKALTISEHRGNDAVHLLALTAQSIQMAKGATHHDIVGTTFYLFCRRRQC